MHNLGLTGCRDHAFLFSVMMLGRCFKVSAELSAARVPTTISKLAVVYQLSHTLLLKSYKCSKTFKKKKSNLTVCAYLEVLLVNGSK